MRIGLDDHERRIFGPTPHDSSGWRCSYNPRSTLERIDNRIGFERHFIGGLAKMQIRVGLALAVTMAMDLGRVKQEHWVHREPQ